MKQTTLFGLYTVAILILTTHNVAAYTTNTLLKTATSGGSYSDTQNALNFIGQRNEDGWVLTVGTPGGSATWNQQLSVDHQQTVTIQGAGDYEAGTAFRVTLTGGGRFYLNPHGGKLLRLTNFQITGSVSPAIEIEGGGPHGGGATFRIDHVKIYNLPDRGVLINGWTDHDEGPAYGLFDNCRFENMDRAVYIHVSGEDVSWTQPMSWGTTDTIMFEDCVFTRPNWIPGLPALDSTVQTDFGNGGLAGIRWAVRHSTFHNWGLVAHGRQHESSTLQVEVMHNTFTNNDDEFWVYMNFRGGTLTAFDNQFLNDYGYVFDLDPDKSGFQQVGRGVVNGSEGLVPAYIWNNVYADGDPVIAASSVQQNRDYYLGVSRPGYTELAYPHPLRSGTPPPPPPPPPEAPAPPTNLSATVQ